MPNVLLQQHTSTSRQMRLILGVIHYTNQHTAGFVGAGSTGEQCPLVPQTPRNVSRDKSSPTAIARRWPWPRTRSSCRWGTSGTGVAPSGRAPPPACPRRTAAGRSSGWSFGAYPPGLGPGDSPAWWYRTHTCGVKRGIGNVGEGGVRVLKKCKYYFQVRPQGCLCARASVFLPACRQKTYVQPKTQV